MNKSKRANPDFLNGVPELLVLSLLAHRPMHGYDLVQAIGDATGGVLEFGEGCIYPLLHKLEAQHLVTSQKKVVAGRSRVVYAIAPKGHTKLHASRVTWQQVVAAVGKLTGGDVDATPRMV